jgi:dipeptidyl aminopeptidase/acylaminoacyl peptidase
LTTVGPDHTSRQLSGPLDGQLTNLAASPDGRYAAAVASLCRRELLLRLELIDLHTGRVLKEWGTPPGSTSVSGLSWAPDGRRLAYTLGTGLGGRGSGFGILDTRESGGQLDPMQPSTRSVVLGGRSCQVVRSLWLGRTGRFAVFAACVDGNQLILLQVRPQLAVVQQGKVLATLPDSALTLGLDAAATDDGRHLLITTDVATYRVDGSRVTRLVDARPSASW